MATPTAYLRIKGQKQGPIKGSSQVNGRIDDIIVVGVTHDIYSPRDLNSGLPSGKRIHKPFQITKELDRSSPLLYMSLASNENISEFELKFYGIKQDGSEALMYTIKLENASISGIHFEKLNIRKPENANLKEFEIISFTYEKIEWTWNEGGIVGQDDWAANV